MDILIPAALEGVITEKNAGNIKAKVSVELANGPITPAADVILSEKDILFVPDILANSGGVIVSYFEWTQNREKSSWSEDEVNRKLKNLISGSFKEIWDISIKKNINLRIAAYILAVSKVAEAVE